MNTPKAPLSFSEWIEKNVSFRDGTESIWIKNQAHYAPTKALFEQCFAAGRLSALDEVEAGIPHHNGASARWYAGQVRALIGKLRGL